MAFTYDSSDLDVSTTSGRLNVVRFLVGDTDTDDQFLQDEEINFALGQNNNNVYYSAAYCARTIGSKLAREVDVQLDGALSESRSSLSTQFYMLAEQLEYQAKKSGSTLGLSAGGINLNNVKTTLLSPTRVPSAFRMGQFDNPTDYGIFDDEDYSS